MEEEFRIIKEFPNYSVSSFGRIKNNKTGRILKPSLKQNGYYGIRLSKTNNVFDKHIHRLIGEAFISNPNNKPCIDHIDNNRANNNINNLRWVSQTENNMNMILNTRNKTNCKGVCFQKANNKWKAEIMKNRERFF